MNHCVPDFEMDDDYSIPTSSSGLSRPRKSSMPEDGIMELLWQNGPVVMPSQNQKSVKRSSPSKYDAVLSCEQSAPREIRSPAGLQEQSASHHNHQHHLFMQEDEMASWLHYPLNDAAFDQDFCSDLLYPAPSVTTATTPVRTIREFRTPAMATTATAVSSLPPIPPARRAEEKTKVQNFAYFSRHKARLEPGPPVSKIVVRESTVVDSTDTLPVGPDSRVSEELGPESRVSETMSGGNDRSGAMAVVGTSSAAAGKEMMTCEITVTSSPGCSSASAEPAQKPPADDRKRKGIEADYAECHSEDVELESSDAKKLVRGSTSAKRSRAAEVHNLSERRRRDRINEKMRALQELIPRCNKSDKASMLDEAIEYLKSLQLQVQMMSMGCGMVPMMFPGVQQYMPPMGMGIGMGIGLDMNRPMMPFPNVLTGSALPTPAAAAHMGPRFPIPAFHMPPVPVPDPSRIQATNQSDPMLNSIAMQNPDQPRVPKFSDPYQQYLGYHHMHLLPPPPQNQAMAQPSSSKSSTSREAENPENHQSGYHAYY